MKRFFSLFILTLGFLPGELWAQKSFDAAVKKIESRFEPAEAKPGQVVNFIVNVELADGWHTYPVMQVDAKAKSQTNRFTFPTTGPGIFVGDISDPLDPKTKSEPSLGIDTILYYPGGGTWERKMVVAPDAKPGEMDVKVRMNILVCEAENCLPPEKVDLNTKLKVLNSPPVDIDPKYRDEVNQVLASRNSVPIPKSIESKKEENPRTVPEVKKVETPPIPKEVTLSTAFRIRSDRDYQADLNTVLSQLPPPEANNAGFVAFILTAMFWGVVTLLTPCVFPMIPITVSYFLKQGEKHEHNPIMMAIVYTLTIIVVLGLSSILLLNTFQKLSTDAWMNIGLGLLFVLFALSLFGMFEIRLPGFMAQYTGAREGKSGYFGTIFMALSFTIVSFTCVAPFLGGFSGMAASGNFSNLQLAMGGLAFASTFAAPFFLLALFPTLLKKLPKSGTWMNTVKVAMGFLELAAALKFFRTAELRWVSPPALFSYDMVLSMWIILLFLCGLYLLNMYRLPHDDPQEHIGVPRMMFGFLAISLGLYLLPALFAKGPEGDRQRPGGTVYAWVDAFLLPEPSPAQVVKGELVWSGDLLRIIEDARTKGQYVFIDFTGNTCTNCKLNEKNVFSKETVKEWLNRYQLAQMYTDWVPEGFYESTPSLEVREDHAKANSNFQQKAFGTIQLPLYVILKPTKDNHIERIGVYPEGKINQEAAFIEFLKKPFEKLPGS